jgi:hypothetical protein
MLQMECGGLSHPPHIQMALHQFIDGCTQSDAVPLEHAGDVKTTSQRNLYRVSLP